MYLLHFHENILVRRELPVEPEQLLLLLGHRLHTQRSARSPGCPRAVEQAARAWCKATHLNIDLVPLGWMHPGATLARRVWWLAQQMNDKDEVKRLLSLFLVIPPSTSTPPHNRLIVFNTTNSLIMPRHTSIISHHSKYKDTWLRLRHAVVKKLTTCT